MRIAAPRLDLEPGRGERWQELGSCRLADGRMFFEPERETSVARTERIAAAKAVCRGCPVHGDCLAYAMTVPERYGIWGGTTAAERSKMRRSAHTAEPEPGP